MNSSKAIRWLAIAAAAFAAGTALAHPGHASPGATTTIVHLLTEPDHVLMLIAALVVGVIAVRSGRAERRASRRQREE
jgi:small neutral amino acid transporter SnatA (MarC family)